MAAAVVVLALVATEVVSVEATVEVEDDEVADVGTTTEVVTAEAV